MNKPPLFVAIWRKRRCYAYLAPTFFMLAVLVYYPPAAGFYRAFFQWDAITRGVFVGLGNFRAMMRDVWLKIAFGNMFLLLAWRVFRSLTVPLIIAKAVFSIRSRRASDAYKLLLVIPLVVPDMVILLLWQFIYDPEVGLLNALLQAVGLGQWQGEWIYSYRQALPSLMLLGFPWANAIYMLTFLAGLLNIPESVLESSRIDGAGTFKRFLTIEIPYLVGQVRLVLIMSVIVGLQSFDYILVLTNGGPGAATLVPALHMYLKAFSYGQYGYACAIGLLLFLTILTISYLNLRLLKPSVEFESK